MCLIADDFTPFFEVVVALRHNHADFLSPCRTQFKNALVYLHGNRTGICHDHCLAGEDICPVILVVVEDVTNQRVYRLVSTKNRFHLTKLFFALFNDIRICILRHNVIFCVDEMQCVLVQLEMNNTTLIVNRSGSTIFDGLRRIINVNAITEHFTGASVFGGNRSAGKPDISSV